MLVPFILVLEYASGTVLNQSFDSNVIYLLTPSLFVTVGALITIHYPGNPVGWIFLASALAIVVGGVSESYAQFITESAPTALPELTLLYWLGAWGWIVAFYVPPTFGILLFPTGRLPSRHWRPFACLVGVWLVLLIAAEMLSPGPLHESGAYPQFTNPFGVESMAGVTDGILEYLEELGLLLAFIGSVASIFARLRVATAGERQQIKWFAYAATIPLAGLGVYFMLLAWPDVGSETADDIGGLIVILGITVLPVVVGIAILRHNLYDIDRLINRTVVYGSLSILLIAGFAGSVVLFQVLLSPFTGGNDLAVAGSTLLVAALFRPVRDRLQRFVDQRFYRQKYDAQRTLQSFGATARDAVDLEQLTGELTSLVAMTMQPAHVSLWLRIAPGREDNT